MLSVTNVLLLMGFIFTLVGALSRSKAAKAGIKVGSQVDNVVMGIIVIGLLLFLMAAILEINSISSTKIPIPKAALLGVSLVLSIVLVVMSGVVLASKDLKDSGRSSETTDSKNAKKNLKAMFVAILVLAIINVFAISGLMKTVEGDISSRFGFDFEF